MTKELENNSEASSGKAKEFVKKYWPHALLIGGTAGAIVWLTARYLKERKVRSDQLNKSLDQVEEEAIVTKDQTVVLLETGGHLGKIAGGELLEATHELELHVKELDAKEILVALRELATQEAERRKKDKPTSG